MKRSELEEIIVEEIYKDIVERTVASRTPPRKMSGAQVIRRDKIGKAMKKKASVVKKFKNAHGSDWEYHLWAVATNKAIDGGE
jgi:hypothetical protein